MTLEAEPARFLVLGLDLRPSDRQHRCLQGGRSDLVCQVKRSKRYVVVERPARTGWPQHRPSPG